MTGWKIQTLLGRSHQEVWDLQEKLREELIQGSDNKHLLLVEHPPTITLGRGEKGQNLHQQQSWFLDNGFDVVTVNRGGEVTYHGPGQLVAYPIFHLQNAKLGIKDYICVLEKAMLTTIAHFELTGHRLEGHPGIYIDGKKIGSVGIHVRKFVTIHGVALNINPDLTHFSQFTPCGIQDIQVTSMVNEGANTSFDEVSKIFQTAFFELVK